MGADITANTTNKLDKTGLAQVWSKIVLHFATKKVVEEIKTTLADLEGAQANVIERVSVNGTELEVTDKGVNIMVPAGTLAGLDKVGIEQLNEALTALINGKADASGVYTKQETDTAIQNAVDTAVTGVYKVKGSAAFAGLPAENMREGDVYNITDDFVTTDAFVEGAGKQYQAGTNVVYTENGWDCMAGIYDYSGFVMKSDLVDITSEEIDAICVIPD